MSSRIHRPTAGDAIVETWRFTEAAVAPDWVRRECKLVEVDGKLALRHERKTGVQIYWLGETLGRCADGSVVFLWPPTFGH
jgi:hypothetical protein